MAMVTVSICIPNNAVIMILTGRLHIASAASGNINIASIVLRRYIYSMRMGSIRSCIPPMSVSIRAAGHTSGIGCRAAYQVGGDRAEMGDGGAQVV